MRWLTGALIGESPHEILDDALISSVFIILWSLFYASPLMVLRRIDKWPTGVRGTVYGLAVVMMLVFVRDSAQDFIYFQF